MHGLSLNANCGMISFKLIQKGSWAGLIAKGSKGQTDVGAYFEILQLCMILDQFCRILRHREVL